jgi:rare lipoprotein A (peptidoglycan hydrolase)
MTFTRKAVTVLASTAAVLLATTMEAQAVSGRATFYDNVGDGACGDHINAGTEVLVAVSAAHWTTPNPNNDPLCRNVFVEVKHNGKTVKARVRDKCPSCDRNTIDLSLPAFRRLANPDQGVINVRWKFIR